MTVPVNACDRYADSQGVSLMAVDQYRREVSWVCTEPLTQEDEELLLRRIERSIKAPGHQHYAMLAKHARERLVEAYQPLVMAKARQFVSYGARLGFEFLDLVSEGNFGVLRAFDLYWQSRFIGNFRLLVAGCVRFSIVQALTKARGLNHVGKENQILFRQVARLRAEVLKAEGRELSERELAERLGVSVERVFEVSVLLWVSRAESLQARITTDDGAEDRQDFVSLFESAAAQEEERHARLAEDLHKALEAVVTPCQRDVLRLKYRFDDGGSRPRVASEIASILGKTRVCVGQQERTGLRRLREVLQPVVSEGLVSCEVGSVDTEDCYTSAEARQLLGMKKSAFWRNVWAGRVPARRIPGAVRNAWVFPKQAIDTLVSDRQVVGA